MKHSPLEKQLPDLTDGMLVKFFNYYKDSNNKKDLALVCEEIIRRFNSPPDEERLIQNLCEFVDCSFKTDFYGKLKNLLLEYKNKESI